MSTHNTLNFKYRPNPINLIVFVVIGGFMVVSGRVLDDDMGTAQGWLILAMMILILYKSFRPRYLILGSDFIQIPGRRNRKDTIQYQDIKEYRFINFAFHPSLMITTHNGLFMVSGLFFGKDDWKKLGREFRLRVPGKEHQ